MKSLMTRIFSFATFSFILVSLTGCLEEDPVITAKKTDPIIENIGIIDGCEVKFVDRGYQTNSFFIAKCGNTVTTTKNWTEKSGKSSVNKRSTIITQEEKEIQSQIDSLTEKKSKLELVQQAKSKLSVDEQKALGLE